MDEVYELIRRVCGNVFEGRIQLLLSVPEQRRRSQFRVCCDGGVLRIEGDGAGSIAAGFHWYLREALHGHVSWDSVRFDTLDVLPDACTDVCSPHELRYYLNYCTHSYSMAYWDWPRWEKEIDFMALSGVNLALSLVGQESVYREFLMRSGYSDEEARAFLPGPAYFAWFLMGNMSGFGGPLPKEWFEDRVVLARKIHERMTKLGIMPVVMGFCGMVPGDMDARVPSLSVIRQGAWNGFTRPDIVRADCPAFDVLAKQFYAAQCELLGDVTHYYAADPFHEGGMVSESDLALFGREIQHQMSAADPDAVWVMQAWGSNPRRALLQATDMQRVLVLNLLGGRQPLWTISEGFYGAPHLWCTIQNYGRRSGMYGFLNVLAREPVSVKASHFGKSMRGMGFAPEAIENNPVCYDLGFSMFWQEKPVDVDAFVSDYAQRRYGTDTDGTQTAWRLLHETVYDSFVRQPGGVESVMCARPKPFIQNVSTWGPKGIEYDQEKVRQALNLMRSEYSILKDVEGYRYDLADLSCQVASSAARMLHERLIYSYQQRDPGGVQRAGNAFLQLMDILEALLAHAPAFTLSAYLREAAQLGARYELSDLFVFNAKAIVSSWGHERAAETLHDYACKEWAGIIGSLYKKRWSLYIDALLFELGSDCGSEVRLDFDWADHRQDASVPLSESIDWAKIEWDWANDSELHEVTPTGSLDEHVHRLIEFVNEAYGFASYGYTKE